MTENKNQKSLEAITFLSEWMDTKFKIPGTSISFGIDAVLSLIPGLGDIASSAISVGIFAMILRKGVPFTTALKMMFNIVLDSLISAIPILGTLLDIGFKANVRNLNLLEDHLNNNPSGEYAYGIWWVFIMTIVLLFSLFIGLILLIGNVVNQFI